MVIWILLILFACVVLKFAYLILKRFTLIMKLKKARLKLLIQETRFGLFLGMMGNRISY